MCRCLVYVGQNEEACHSRPSCHPLLSPAKSEYAAGPLVKDGVPR